MSLALSGARLRARRRASGPAWGIVAILSVGAPCVSSFVEGTGAFAHEPSPESTEPAPAPAQKKGYASKVVGKPQITASERRIEQAVIALTPLRYDLVRPDAIEELATWPLAQMLVAGGTT